MKDEVGQPTICPKCRRQAVRQVRIVAGDSFTAIGWAYYHGEPGKEMTTRCTVFDEKRSKE